MGIKSFEGYDRRVIVDFNVRVIIVEFTCRRCGAKAYKRLPDCPPWGRTINVSDLYDLEAPENWRNGGFYYPTFCPDCAKKYDEFMAGEVEK